MSDTLTTDDIAAYAAASTSLAVADRSARVRLRVTGPDRTRFLNNLCTNDVKRLALGHGLEAFITSPRGKTLGLVTIHAQAEWLLLRTDAGGLAGLVPHFQKYGALDDVSWEDRSPRTTELHFVGPNADEHLSGLGTTLPGPETYAIADGPRVVLVREAPTGRPGVTLIVATEDLEPSWTVGLPRLGPAAFDALRIEAGTPEFGRDLTSDTLPQEVGRDRQAIHFTKGCYLGQETVARIDALGHVNTVLKGLTLAGEAAAGAVLSHEGKPVGKLTSVAYSPGWDGWIALGRLRVAQAQPGQALEAEGAGGAIAARAHDLPFLPPGGVNGP